MEEYVNHAALVIAEHEPIEGDGWEAEGAARNGQQTSIISRNCFPKDFLFGSGTSSYQVEGAYAQGGRALTIWDDFCLRTPEKIANGSNGVVACDMYHRYKEDIGMMKQLGFNSYRFSISWTRILPGGRSCVGINTEGIQFYDDVINTVIANGMTPFVTIFHWDLPLSLEREYGGFLSEKIRDDFREFARICFWAFGDRVKIWATVNEPLTYAVSGYVMGRYPPGKKLGVPDKLKTNKFWAHRGPVSDTDHLPPALDGKSEDLASPKDAYTVARNLLLCHADTVKLYRTMFKESQKGKIGMVLPSPWCVPYDSKSEADQAATQRALDFTLGWFLEPVLHGTYPKSMIENVNPENLTPFKPEDQQLLRGSIDFLGLNYYTATYVSYRPKSKCEGYPFDMQAKLRSDGIDGKPIGPPAKGSPTWLFVVPWGIYDLLEYIKNKYTTLKEIYITENGYSDKNDCTVIPAKACEDIDRTKYHQDHLANIYKVMRDKKVNVKGYFAWSWCDNFEWSSGYTARFGLVYIDFNNELRRYPKDSVLWFAEFLKSDRKLPPRQLTSGKRPLEGGEENVEADKRLRVMEND